MKEKFPGLQDEDLPLFEMGKSKLVARIARATGQTRVNVRRVLYEIGVFVPRRKAVHELHPSAEPHEESLGSGIPDDTGPSGIMGLVRGW